MVSNKPYGNILILIGLVCCPCKRADTVTDSLHCIDIEYGINILDNYSQSLKSHSRIDILVGKFCISTLTVTVKLGENIVPDFHKSVAVAAHLTVRLSTAVFYSAVIIYLRTGSAGTCTMFPEIIALTGLGITVKSCDLFSRDADFLIPDFECLIILSIYGRIKSVRIHAHCLGKEFPAPLYCLVLKVITEREIS